MISIKGITDVHDLHVWAITNDKISLTAHLVIEAGFNHEIVREEVQTLLFKQFKISHTTLQIENKDQLKLCSTLANNSE